MIGSVSEKPAPIAKKKNKTLLVHKNVKKPKAMKETDPLALYLKQISRYALLSAEEELSLGEHTEHEGSAALARRRL
jgi:RNA polymerase primary sigma factor